MCVSSSLWGEDWCATLLAEVDMRGDGKYPCGRSLPTGVEGSRRARATLPMYLREWGIVHRHISIHEMRSG